MKLLINNKDKETSKAIVIAENEEERKFIEFLYANGMVWGFYMLWLKSSKEVNHSIIKALLEKYPQGKAIGFFRSPKGFVDTYESKLIGSYEYMKKKEEKEIKEGKTTNLFDNITGASK